MILYKLIFGSIENKKRNEATDFIEYYISALLHNGQACGEYVTVLQKNKLCAYVTMQGVKANTKNNHSKWGEKWLVKIEEIFGCRPSWELIDDEFPKKEESWEDTPFLYLSTNLNDFGSPIRKGSNGKRVPVYLLPGEHEDRESIYFWQRAYKNHDSIWMACGELEIPTYKQLAVPSSELSENGREICSYIEKTTGIPTFYYLMRHWGRRSNEEHRRCPGCGENWAVENRDNDLESPFHKFDFSCDPCRLVSHISSASDDERHAVIGEWKKPKKV